MAQELIDTRTGEISSPVLSLADVKQQVNLIQHVMRDVMQDGQHYGKIPGCGDKPALLKAGAEKLTLTFRLAPSYRITTRELPMGHREYEIVCQLRHIDSEKFIGEGLGICSTMESKYRYRSSARKCPKCGAEAIVQGKKEYGGGWLCFAKKGGCGAKFQDGDKTIEAQVAGKSDNPDIADAYNTVLKMAKKRALVDATLSSTAASDIFTQDIDEKLEEPEASREAKRTVKTPEPIQAGPKAGAAVTRPADDQGSSSGLEIPFGESTTGTITQAQIAKLMAKCHEAGITEEKLNEWIYRRFKKSSKKDLTSEELDQILLGLKALPGA